MATIFKRNIGDCFNNELDRDFAPKNLHVLNLTEIDPGVW